MDLLIQFRDLFFQFVTNTGFYILFQEPRNLIMFSVGCVFVYLAIAKEYEPLLLLPIGFGIIIGNVPFFKGFGLGIYEDNSVLHYLYFGVTTGLYPSIVFLGLGAMTDFSSLLARPKLMLLGAAAPPSIHIFSTPIFFNPSMILTFPGWLFSVM